MSAGVQSQACDLALDGQVERPLVIDGFCGRGGWTKGLVKAGFDVIGFDLLPQDEYPVGPHVRFLQADVRSLHAWDFPRLPYATVLSPPCQPFSTMRPDNKEPPRPEGYELVAHTLRLIAELRPKFWAIENVRGALKWWEPTLGSPDVRARPYYLWGNLPFDFRAPGKYPSKLQYRDPGRRSEIPASLADELGRSLMGEFQRSVSQSNLAEFAGGR